MSSHPAPCIHLHKPRLSVWNMLQKYHFFFFLKRFFGFFVLKGLKKDNEMRVHWYIPRILI